MLESAVLIRHAHAESNPDQTKRFVSPQGYNEIETMRPIFDTLKILERIHLGFFGATRHRQTIEALFEASPISMCKIKSLDIPSNKPDYQHIFRMHGLGTSLRKWLSEDLAHFLMGYGLRAVHDIQSQVNPSGTTNIFCVGSYNLINCVAAAFIVEHAIRTGKFFPQGMDIVLDSKLEGCEGFKLDFMPRSVGIVTLNVRNR